MGSKQRRKQNRPAPVAPPSPTSSNTPWAMIAVAIVAVAGAGFFVMSRSDDASATSTAVEDTTEAATTRTATSPTVAPVATEFSSEELDALPLPPLPYVAQTAGPADLMRQAYIFAAKNPGVLSYVPCYCGCGQSDGHVSNVDCFVESRAQNGAVTEWDIHGMT
ncbi:MAG: PCYCGC motif-containing (lipo)protein [Acidobacteriota bacterium]|nr:PCYCGC motif-containing (lipo)protein [Acidobacteriota bacterium]